jgi:hypothetical protein
MGVEDVKKDLVLPIYQPIYDEISSDLMAKTRSPEMTRIFLSQKLRPLFESKVDSISRMVANFLSDDEEQGPSTRLPEGVTERQVQLSSGKTVTRYAVDMYDPDGEPLQQQSIHETLEDALEEVAVNAKNRGRGGFASRSAAKPPAPSAPVISAPPRPIPAPEPEKAINYGAIIEQEANRLFAQHRKGVE